MNQESRDKRIRELFSELGAEDERRTPSFGAVLEPALFRRRQPVRRFAWRVAGAVALPVIVLALALALLANRSTESLPPVDLSLVQPPPSILVQPFDIKPDESTQAFNSGPRNRKSSSRRPRQSIQISQWRAPTDFLLKTPGSEFLQTLPRMPDSPTIIPRGLQDKQN